MNTKSLAGLAASFVLILSIFSSASKATGHNPASENLTFTPIDEKVAVELLSSDIMHQALLDTVFGCTYPWAAGYDPEATVDDGSCEEFVVQAI